MIDLIYQIVKTIINKELRGNLKPAEFNLLASQAQTKIFNSYFTDINQEQNKENRGISNKGFSNLPLLTRQKIHQFSKTATLTYSTDRFLLPTDLYFIKDRGVLSGTKVVDEGRTERSVFKNSSKTAVSTTFPKYERFSDYIFITPATIVSGVTCKYIRKPLDPKWTYTIVSNIELFDNTQVDYQDFELHVSESDNLVEEILSLAGVNIRDLDISRYAEALKRITEVKKEQ